MNLELMTEMHKITNGYTKGEYLSVIAGDPNRRYGSDINPPVLQFYLKLPNPTFCRFLL